MYLGKEHKNNDGSFAILFAAFLWGTTGTVASFAPQINPLAIGAFAMGVGGLLQTLFARKMLRQDFRLLLTCKKKLLIGAMAIAIYPLAFYSSMRLAGVAIGTVVSIASAPLITAILEGLFSKKSYINRRWVISFAFGVAGILLLTYTEPAVQQHSEQNIQKYTGVLLGLLAGLTYAIYSWVARSVIEDGARSESAMGSLFGLGAIILIPSLLFTGDQLFSSMNNAAVALYMALIPMFLGYIAFGVGLRSVNASKATLLTLFEPVVAACLAVLVVGEVIPLAGWVGMLFITLCLVLQARRKAIPASVTGIVAE